MSFCNASVSLLKMPNSVITSAVFIGVNLLLFVAIVMLNLPVIIAIVICKRLHTLFHVNILCLCSSDLVVASLSVPLNLFVNYFCAPDLEMYCTAHNILLFFTDIGFVMTSCIVVAIAVDRCRAVVKPLRQLGGKRSVAMRISVIIACAVVYATAMFFSELEWQKHPEYDIYKDICNVGTVVERGYVFLIDPILFYCVPLCISACLYARVILQLWREMEQMDAAPDSHVTAGALQRKKRAMKISVCIVIVFAVMWLPYHSAHIYFNIYPDKLTQDIWWLLPACNVSYLNFNWMNSIVYVYFSVAFREELLLRWRSCVGCKPAINCSNGVERNTASTVDTRTSSIASSEIVEIGL
ncbi:PREDICTED: tachykinin-like peptides receptor 99D [Priapulus caudatus]|uniref:Tachykinin-like peptides receptor 99D n=1 Tax=Priapulus caudatus TaxID=37621 RepID=A0ABM1E854_PRICU|nr:PREDICTED: tachykinin-like peptides receptor 99D [Priapulus caudatus]